jgi:FKBP-type peptidyl-prolyl cis-trans isomerase FklB
MKTMGFVAITVVSLVLAGCGGKNDAGKMKNLEDSVSYAIGLETGKNLREQNFVLNPDFVKQGIADADTTKGKPAFTAEQLRVVVKALQERLQSQHAEKMKVQGEKNKADGAAFLAANKNKPGVITTASGLQYKIITNGTGPKPKLNQIVGIKFRGATIDGVEFDNSVRYGEPVSIPVGAVNKGWTEALQLMPVGSKWQLFIPSDLAFGDRSPYPTVAPNAVLVYEIEIINIDQHPVKK